MTLNLSNRDPGHSDRAKWIFLFLLFTTHFLMGKAIDLEGNYQYNVYLGHPTPMVTKSFNFKVILDGCSWIIDYQNAAPTIKDADNLRVVSSCDGTATYTVHLPSGIADVSLSTYPYDREVHLQYIWIAFASHCMLRNAEGTAKPPFAEDIAIFNRKDYVCQYKWITTPSGIPTNLIFLNDGSYFYRNSITGVASRGRRSSPYAQGFKLAEGSWISATNVAGELVPLEFRFVGFGPKRNASSADDLSKMFTFDCVVTNLAVVDAPSIPGKLPDKAYVSDRRFADLGYAYVTYVVTNNVWPKTNNSAIRELLGRAPKFSAEDEALAELGIRQIGDKVPMSQKSSRRETTKWIFIFLVIAPAICFVAYMLKTKASN